MARDGDSTCRSLLRAMPQKQLKARDFEVLTQPVFLVALLLLIANDHYFKSHYHNALTGKLSDFAGLFVFVQFVAVLSGFRIAWVAIVSAMLFAVWKSPYATPLIEAANQFLPIAIHRTIDYTDLIALAVLPFAVRLYGVRTHWRLGIFKYPVAALTLLAIMATSSMPPSYNVRFDLKDKPNHGTAIDVIYTEIDKSLISHGMRCVKCEKDGAYREYFDPQGNITAKLHYDNVEKHLYIALNTYSPDSAKTRTDALQVKLMELLRPRFENITVSRMATRYETTAPRRTVWTLQIDAPRVGFSLSCAGNGIKHPEIAKALAITDDLVRSTLPTGLQSEGCYATDSRCSLDMCRHATFGRIIGPHIGDRSIRVSTRGYLEWGGTTLVVDVAEYGDLRGQAGEFVDNLEKRLRGSLSRELSIKVVRPAAQPPVSIDAPPAVLP